MRSIDGAILDFKRLDLIATGETASHRLDARAKVLVTLVFIVLVVSFGKYELTALLPFFVYPVVMTRLADLPAGYLLRKVAVVLPFALLVGLFNPLFDREPVSFGSLSVAGGWVSLASIVLRAALTISAAFILAGMTGFAGICQALERMGLPQAIVVQLLLLYRYIFVLTDEGARTARARELRSFGGKLGVKAFGSLAGHLLLRTWERAERIHMAMLARGFQGQFRTRQSSRFGLREVGFLLGWSGLFFLFRWQNISEFLGSFITGIVK